MTSLLYYPIKMQCLCLSDIRKFGLIAVSAHKWRNTNKQRVGASYVNFAYSLLPSRITSFPASFHFKDSKDQIFLLIREKEWYQLQNVADVVLQNSVKRLSYQCYTHLEELSKCNVIQSIRTVKHNTLFSYSFGQILSSFSLSCSCRTLGCTSQMQL